jgi:hypothetical protein
VLEAIPAADDRIIGDKIASVLNEGQIRQYETMVESLLGKFHDVHLAWLYVCELYNNQGSNIDFFGSLKSFLDVFKMEKSKVIKEEEAERTVRIRTDEMTVSSDKDIAELRAKLKTAKLFF